MRNWAATVFLLFINSHLLLAQQSFDLSECLIYTLGNSPKLKADAIAQRKESATFYQNKSSFLPQVDAFLNYHNFFSDLPTYIFPQTEGSNLAGIPVDGPYPVQLGLPHNLNAGFEINQTIFDMNFFGNGQLDQHFQSYKDLQLSMAEEEILYQVAVMYYQIAINKERLDFLNMNLERLVRLQPIVNLQVEQGFARATDLDKLIVKTSNLNSKKNKLQSGIEQQKRYLKFMMGLSQSDEFSLQYEPINPSNATIAERSEEGHFSERLLVQQKELNSMNAKRINADYYPKLQAYAAFLFQAQRDRLNFLQSNQDWYNIHQWGLKLSIPVMRGFEKKNKKEVSELVDEQLSLGIEQKQLQNELEYQNAVLEFEVAREEEIATMENISLAEKMYRQSELSYEQGSLLLMDFLDAEATLREAKMVYATALLDTRIAELKVLKASGRLKDLVN